VPLARPTALLLAAVLPLALAACGVEPRPGAGPALRQTPAADRASLQARVLDADGAPAAGAWLTVSPRGFEAQTGADGTASLERLPPGAATVRAARDGATATAEVTLVAGEDLELELALPAAPARGAAATVRVTGPDGAPLAGVELRDEAGAQATTDRHGAATLVGIEGAAVSLHLDDPEGRVAAASLGVGGLPAAGGVQWQPTLSGRASADARHLGSTACGACHPDALDTWQTTAHAHALDADGPPADASDRPVPLGGGATATPAWDGAWTVTLVDADGDAEVFRVAGWIGWPDRSSVPWVEGDGAAWPLPIAWRAADPARPGYPGASAGWSAWETDRWLDADGVRAPLDPAGSAEAACFGCHATGFTLTARSDGGADMAATVGFGRWLEGAVGCEACHGAGGDHRRAAAAGARYEIVHPGRLDVDRAQDACGACHAATDAHGTVLPFAGRGSGGFVPGDQLDDHATDAGLWWPSGAAAGPNQQHGEHRASAHGALRCADCHAPHGEGAAGSLWASATDNSLCLSCHLGLDFDDDDDLVQAHLDHARIDPAGVTEGGRCVGCHMPGTATHAAWDPASGAGEVASHTLLALAPAETLAAFDAAGADRLSLGDFPAHACGDCHAWNAWRFGLSGVAFPGEAGDPTARATHEAHQDAFEERAP